ncbi:ABC transporter substrate-binding protein [Paenarthrobacter sp. NPDC090517]|uniref:ABC transporter substrate-binding protein n=1 Tax=Paenarthrobacter sp. NPDC090517 TaxID=3364381 RepID=UPI0037F5AD2E
MRTRLVAPLTAVALSGAMLFGATGPASAAPPPAASAVQLANVTAVINETIPGVGTFVGSFTPTQFGTDNGALTVTGLLTGTFTSVTGVVTQISQTVTTTVTGAATQAACQILSLDLGPLDLDVLGLVVELNQVQLDITAVPGAGNLLGNLLCAVAGLLDGNGLTGLANLLNRLLGL